MQRELVVFDKVGPGVAMTVLGTVFFVGGLMLLLAPTLFGLGEIAYVLGAIFGLIGPVVILLAKSVMSERLVVTDEGLIHQKGQGLLSKRYDVVTIPWTEIACIEKQRKVRRTSQGSSVSHLLIAHRKDQDAYTYLMGFPQSNRLRELFQLCEQRGVVAKS
jgi:hypothetical protein